MCSRSGFGVLSEAFTEPFRVSAKEARLSFRTEIGIAFPYVHCSPTFVQEVWGRQPEHRKEAEQQPANGPGEPPPTSVPRSALRSADTVVPSDQLAPVGKLEKKRPHGTGVVAENSRRRKPGAVWELRVERLR